MNKKILLLSHCFPPYAFPESYLIVKKFNFMKNYDIDVITMRSFLPRINFDYSFEQYSNNKFNKVCYLSPPAFYKKLPFSKLEMLFSVPDPYVYLNYLYIKKIKNNIEKYDFIITWSMYHSIHLVGLMLRKLSSNLKWIAHFSDPWTTNTFFKKNKIVQYINKIFERKVVYGAHALSFTSQETQLQFLGQYPEVIKEKSHVIPHNYDESLFINSNDNCIEKKNQFIIRYIGTFYQERQPFSLFAALTKIKTTNVNLLENIIIEFIGSTDQKYSISKDIEKYISFLAPVEYMCSLKKMCSAQMLLIVDAPCKVSPFLPSKLIDYIGANKPIFGITPPGTAQKLIEEMGYLVAHPDNPEEIAGKLMQMINNIKAGNIHKIPEHIRERFSGKTVAKQMVNILEELTF